MSDNQKWNSALIKTGPKSVTHIYYDLDQFWSWLGQDFFINEQIHLGIPDLFGWQHEHVVTHTRESFKLILSLGSVVDPATVLKLQEHMHEQNKRLDQERNVRMTLENKMRSLSKEKNELIK